MKKMMIVIIVVAVFIIVVDILPSMLGKDFVVVVVVPVGSKGQATPEIRG